MKKIFIGSLLLVLMLPLFAKPAIKQKVANTPERVYKLINADHIFLSKVNGEFITELLGHVHFFYDDIEFFTDRSVLFEKQKIVRMEGNVKVLRDTLYLEADSAAYYRIPDRINLGSRVYVKETHQDRSIRTFHSSYAVYQPGEKSLDCTTAVTFYDQRENVRGKCGKLIYREKDGYGYLIDNPEVSVAGEDTITIRSEKMEYFKQFSKLIATFNVHTDSPDYHATSDFLIYLNDEEKAVFSGTPRLTSTFGDAEAVMFYMYFTQRKLVRAELQDSCVVHFSEEENQPATNWCKADFIKMYFDNREIRHFTAENHVSYFYASVDKKTKEKSQNQATGELMHIVFKAGNKVDYLKMERQIRGTYKFQNKT